MPVIFGLNKPLDAWERDYAARAIENVMLGEGRWIESIESVHPSMWCDLDRYIYSLIRVMRADNEKV